MDFGDITENLPLIAMIVGFILLQFFLKRRRKPEATQQEIAQSLLTEVRLNVRLATASKLDGKARRFITTSWRMNENKLDFLDPSLQSKLSDAFAIAEDCNQRIAAAKKYKSTSYLAGIDMDKVIEKITKSQEGLEQWFLSKTGTKEPPPQTPSMFGNFVGR